MFPGVENWSFYFKLSREQGPSYMFSDCGWLEDEITDEQQ